MSLTPQLILNRFLIWQWPDTPYGSATAFDLDSNTFCLVTWAAPATEAATLLRQEHELLQQVQADPSLPQVLGWEASPEVLVLDSGRRHPLSGRADSRRQTTPTVRYGAAGLMSLGVTCGARNLATDGPCTPLATGASGADPGEHACVSACTVGGAEE